MAAANEKTTLRTKLDRFWSILFLTPEGRPKSAVLLYSFCLSLLFMVVYGLSYFFLIDVIEGWFANSSVTVRNIFESVLPGLAGSIVCCPLWFVFKDKRIMSAAYVWITFFAVAVLVAMALLSGPEEFRIFLYFYAMIVPVGLISGTVFTHHMYGRVRRREKLEQSGEEDAQS